MFAANGMRAEEGVMLRDVLSSKAQFSILGSTETWCSFCLLSQATTELGITEHENGFSFQ